MKLIDFSVGEPNLPLHPLIVKAQNELFCEARYLPYPPVQGLKELCELVCEETPYKPSSPYSASKASSDHLVRSWNRTYELPIIITNCSNNYGPYQHNEKLIPLMISNALNEKKLPVYGNGEQIRDWLYVEDHAEALCCVLKNGEIGQTYNIGGNNQVKNIEVVKEICSVLDTLKPRLNNKSYSDLISFVKDRPGHDIRYAMNISKIQEELNWKPKESFKTGLKKTIIWNIEQYS